MEKKKRVWEYVRVARTPWPLRNESSWEEFFGAMGSSRWGLPSFCNASIGVRYLSSSPFISWAFVSVFPVFLFILPPSLQFPPAETLISFHSPLAGIVRYGCTFYVKRFMRLQCTLGPRCLSLTDPDSADPQRECARLS